MNKSRFTMLLLEPGEIYFEDYSSKMSEDEMINEYSKSGRLKICSKSLVFEPHSITEPLIKMHLKECLKISSVYSRADTNDKSNVLKVEIKQYCEMLEDNILAPYRFKYESKVFYFHLDFLTTDECLNHLLQLHRASTLPAQEHNSMIATIIHSRYMRMVFDPVMMDDYTEQILSEYQVEKISPLVRHQGKLALTPTMLYFQPFSNIECNPILKIKLKDMRRMYKRRFLLRQVGLEIYCTEESPISHIYLTFQNSEDRDKVCNTLDGLPSVNLERVHMEEMTLQWQNGIVSNYDYLSYLNCLADRSKNDLTQYPVFPWVIADYSSDTLDLDNIETFRDLSKPMGALNPKRLEKLLERYHEMSDPKFIYGSHYSAPGLVLFYLVRKYPHYMLCLQNGRFDHPDRMFNSLLDVYNNCLRNMSDFKELVPEFYDTSAKGDFLVNIHDINFGYRHDGTKVDNVQLPPWARSPEDFVNQLRAAFESEYVSKHLHQWIDLIFGYKQRGEEAVKAYNVYHHVCYEGSIDLETIFDMNDRHAFEVQIMEFGQVPTQLFTKPHVRKITHKIPRLLTRDHNGYRLECVDTIKLHKEAVTCVIRSGGRVMSVGKDGILKVYDMVLKKQIRSVVLCRTQLSSCVMVDEHILAAGGWDNEIYLYDVEYGRIVESFRAHDDSVSCLLWLKKELLLVSGGWDGVVRVWSLVGKVGQALRGLRAEFDHDGNITTVASRYRKFELDILAGTNDGEVFIWEYRSKDLLNKIRIHSSPVRGVCMLTSDRIVTVCGGGDMTVTDLNVLNTVFEKNMGGEIYSLCCDGFNVVWVGDSEGQLLQWDLIAVTRLQQLSAHDDIIQSIFYDAPSQTVVTASADKSVKIWSLSEMS
ncbi:protein FAN-like [Leptidea sinapis]|uniref:protein FAN-like n=1 Tax=Leptidea sinapis TaxID=189913 RepID=UPI002146ED08|nr:protein FAN-like [Leptidea sinapis]XP_050670490.1 protein FAN-like [Leptidea sinapis]